MDRRNDSDSVALPRDAAGWRVRRVERSESLADRIVLLVALMSTAIMFCDVVLRLAALFR